MKNASQIEQKTKVVYGDTFERYNKEEFLEFLKPLEVRLAKNGIDQAVFKDKLCLDAGCGGGRASVLMARAGAKKVISYDLTEKNIETTKRNAALFGLTNIETQHGSLLEIPFKDETFDVVWCNGVLHHTVDPDKTLQEVTRVLKVNGHFWLYLYGSGGIYWFMVDFLRAWLKHIDVKEAIAQLAVGGVPTGRIAEFIDDWYVPMLKRYTDEDVTARLKELGFAAPRYLSGGMSYDTSTRRAANQKEIIWMGGGDVRYWSQKTSKATGQNKHVLPDVDDKGSFYADAPEVLEFSRVFDLLAAEVERLEKTFSHLGQSPRILIAARMQTWLRDTMTKPDSFDGALFYRWIEEQISALKKLSSDR